MIVGGSSEISLLLAFLVVTGIAAGAALVSRSPSSWAAA
jgi:hypothetical protein